MQINVIFWNWKAVWHLVSNNIFLSLRAWSLALRFQYYEKCSLVCCQCHRTTLIAWLICFAVITGQWMYGYGALPTVGHSCPDLLHASSDRWTCQIPPLSCLHCGHQFYLYLLAKSYTLSIQRQWVVAESTSRAVPTASGLQTADASCKGPPNRIWAQEDKEGKETALDKRLLQKKKIELPMKRKTRVNKRTMALFLRTMVIISWIWKLWLPPLVLVLY